MVKILNLFSGIGGNVAGLNRDFYFVTSIESDNRICEVYRKLYPMDIVYCCDAYDYLLNNYMYYDFIWASPPCQSHSRSKSISFKKPYYVDLGLYKIILFLQKYCKDKLWLVENVIPFYSPLINPSYILDRHYVWCNFVIPPYYSRGVAGDVLEVFSLKSLCTFHNIDINIFDGLDFTYIEKRQVLRNCCTSDFGLHCITSAFFIHDKYNQLQLF